MQDHINTNAFVSLVEKKYNALRNMLRQLIQEMDREVRRVSKIVTENQRGSSVPKGHQGQYLVDLVIDVTNDNQRHARAGGT